MCFRYSAAFEPGGFRRDRVGGNKILILWRDSCLWAWWVSWGWGRRQQNLDFMAR